VKVGGSCFHRHCFTWGQKLLLVIAEDRSMGGEKILPGKKYKMEEDGPRSPLAGENALSSRVSEQRQDKRAEEKLEGGKFEGIMRNSHIKSLLTREAQGCWEPGRKEFAVKKPYIE